MHGLVSLLPEHHYKRVEGIWQDLEDDFGLAGIRVTPYPHFSWQIAETYDVEALARIAQTIAAESRPFLVRTSGLGLFSGPRPVIYIPVVKTAELLAFHAQVWERCQSAAQGLSPFYSPDQWMPHISLAYTDVTESNIGPVLRWLAFVPFQWEFTVDNLAFIEEPAGEVGRLAFQVPFQG